MSLLPDWNNSPFLTSTSIKRNSNKDIYYTPTHINNYNNNPQNNPQNSSENKNNYQNNSSNLNLLQERLKNLNQFHEKESKERKDEINSNLNLFRSSPILTENNNSNNSNNSHNNNNNNNNKSILENNFNNNLNKRRISNENNTNSNYNNSHSNYNHNHNNNHSYNISTSLNHRELLSQKDLEFDVCLLEVKIINDYITSINQVLNDIESHINTEGGIDNKALLKFLHPLKNKLDGLKQNSYNNGRNNQNNNNSNILPPREILVLTSTVQKLHSDLQSLLQIFTQSLLDKSKIYQEQLKQFRERSNMGARNALQVEKAGYHTAILQLKEQHAKDLRDMAEQHMKSVAESEQRISAFTTEFEELRLNSQLVNELKKELKDVENKIQRAVEKTREEENHKAENRIHEIREQCQLLLKEAEETIQSRQKHLEEYHQEKLDMQRQHHEQMYQFLQLERDKLEKQNTELVKELSLQREQFNLEKEKIMKETAIQRQRVEHEADEMRADHLKTVSAVKAELTAKIRQLKLEEKQRAEDYILQFRREKEQYELEHASEIDRLIQQHKSNIGKIKAQLEVKHEEEFKLMKRKHDNETRRYTTEIDRLRRLIARNGVSNHDNDSNDNDNFFEESRRSHSQSQSLKSTQKLSSTTRSLNSYNSPEPINSTLNTQNFRNSVKFQDNPEINQYKEKDIEQLTKEPEPILRISDNNRSFSLSPTKSLDWKELRKSMELQEVDLSRSTTLKSKSDVNLKSQTKPELESKSNSKSNLSTTNNVKSLPKTKSITTPKTNLKLEEQSRSNDLKVTSNPTSNLSSKGYVSTPSSSLSYSPSPKRIRDYLNDSNSSNNLDKSFEVPPPPPPDQFSLDVALETSKFPGHNVASNASKVESYMSKLERYLQGDKNSILSNSGFSLEDEQYQNYEETEEDIIFPMSHNLDYNWRTNQSILEDDSLNED